MLQLKWIVVRGWFKPPRPVECEPSPVRRIQKK